MEANLNSPIGLGEITAAAGVPGRTLLEHFRRCQGISPIAYLCRARFVRVREALRAAEASENVTGIAMSLGFRGGFGRIP
jgi:transcriptional regulator GlxA family with amidase domain